MEGVVGAVPGASPATPVGAGDGVVIGLSGTLGIPFSPKRTGLRRVGGCNPRLIVPQIGCGLNGVFGKGSGGLGKQRVLLAYPHSHSLGLVVLVAKKCH